MYMCKNAYKKISSKTGKSMIFCKLFGNEGALSQLCISQKYCPKEGQYVEKEQERNCKNYKK